MLMLFSPVVLKGTALLGPTSFLWPHVLTKMARTSWPSRNILDMDGQEI